VIFLYYGLLCVHALIWGEEIKLKKSPRIPTREHFLLKQGILSTWW